MQLGDLPRDGTGQILGRYRLRHVRTDFCAHLGPAHFENGVTTQPLEGFALGRVMAGLVNEVEAEPWEDCATAPAAAEPEAENAALATPTTWAEIEALSESAVRALAAELGCTDRRMGELRLRRFIADELEIERPGLPNGA